MLSACATKATSLGVRKRRGTWVSEALNAEIDARTKIWLKATTFALDNVYIGIAT